jgi:hypothetical protein
MSRPGVNGARANQRRWEFERLVRFTPRSPESSRPHFWPYPLTPEPRRDTSGHTRFGFPNVTRLHRLGHARCRPTLIGANMAGLTQVEPSETGSQVERPRVLTPGERGQHLSFGFLIVLGLVAAIVIVMILVGA